jgi:hypothetical protein
LKSGKNGKKTLFATFTARVGKEIAVIIVIQFQKLFSFP